MAAASTEGRLTAEPGRAAAVTPDTGTRLAVDRTRLAHERTLMAWVRTAASLISFGFTIYKFFELELPGKPAAGDRLIGSREFATILVVTGVASLAIAWFQHRQSMLALSAEFGGQPASSAGVFALFIATLGILALLAVVLGV